MNLEIKDVRHTRNGAFGNFLMRGRNRAVITISLKLNSKLAEYGATLLHELLHLWTTMMRLRGFKVTDRVEHEFIYAAEDKILRAAKKYIGRPK